MVTPLLTGSTIIEITITYGNVSEWVSESNGCPACSSNQIEAPWPKSASAAMTTNHSHFIFAEDRLIYIYMSATDHYGLLVSITGISQFPWPVVRHLVRWPTGRSFFRLVGNGVLIFACTTTLVHLDVAVFARWIDWMNDGEPRVP